MNIFKRIKRFAMMHNLPVMVMGGASIMAHTRTTARLKELDENGVYQYTEERREIRNRVVTTEFVDFLVDQMIAETSEFGDFKFHQCGLGVTAENITDSGIETDTGISPVTGTQVETDHDTYKSVATMIMDATEAITEHVVMSQSGAGTCIDRTKFGAINVVSGNQIEFTFEISFTAGG